ncbi:acyl-CoA dehydrogenase family protein [Rhodococcus gannanensis]|uniref:Acyl-CoA dehydrogenase family protein n=1 Tax=Rhodococcus gannanensis TaxID=1960308 RepID=A0ABW4PAW5_9NOCA
MTVADVTTRTAAEAVTAADADPFVARVAHYAETVLRPTALETDRTGVDAERIAEFSRNGLLNHAASAQFGGAGIDRGGDRRLHEILSGACFNTWLVWAQHAPIVGRLTETLAKGTELPEIGYEILRGRVLLGAAVSDVRRFPRHYIAATRTSGGWTFSGTVSWVSGWGLNTVLTVAAVEASTGTVVTALVPVGDRTRAEPLGLSAVAGSRTEQVVLDDVEVPDVNVIGTEPLSDWRNTDLGTSSDARAHHFGLAESVLRELEQTRNQLAGDVAAAWRPRVAQLRTDAYALADEAQATRDGRHRIGERLATKAASGEALTTLTRALVVARAGHGIRLDDTAQLYARSALFVLVQGQTTDVRDAQLTRLAR